MTDTTCRLCGVAEGEYHLPQFHSEGWSEHKHQRVRQFDTGATRDVDTNKLDYEGFLSPFVLERFARYMHKHRVQADGSLRASDNWQKGIPFDAYMKSGWRHFMQWWTAHRNDAVFNDEAEDILCALLFNVQGYLHEVRKQRPR